MKENEMIVEQRNRNSSSNFKLTEYIIIYRCLNIYNNAVSTIILKLASM